MWTAWETDSPAMIAGIQSGDIITGFNGERIEDMQSYTTRLQETDEEKQQRFSSFEEVLRMEAMWRWTLI